MTKKMRYWVIEPVTGNKIKEGVMTVSGKSELEIEHKTQMLAMKKENMNSPWNIMIKEDEDA